MIVTQMEELSKKRQKIHTDEGVTFVLYPAEIRQFRIALNETISEAAYHEIMTNILSKRAKLRAMNLLQSREYTEVQLRRKLKEGFYPAEIIEQALSYVAGFHYTDDCRYAVSFMQDHEMDKSRRRIEQDLITRGIDRKTLEQAWLSYEEQGGYIDEEYQVKRLLDKRGYNPQNTNPTECRKHYAFLMGKGYQNDVVRRMLRTCEEY